MDDDEEGGGGGRGSVNGDFATPTPKRTTWSRNSDVGVGADTGTGTGIGKRRSISRLPAPSGGRLSFGRRGGNEENEVPRPMSSRSNRSVLDGVGEQQDDETF